MWKQFQVSSFSRNFWEFSPEKKKKKSKKSVRRVACFDSLKRYVATGSNGWRAAEGRERGFRGVTATPVSQEVRHRPIGTLLLVLISNLLKPSRRRFLYILPFKCGATICHFAEQEEEKKMYVPKKCACKYSRDPALIYCTAARSQPAVSATLQRHVDGIASARSKRWKRRVGSMTHPRIRSKVKWLTLRKKKIK